MNAAIQNETTLIIEDLKKLIKGAGQDRFKNYHRVLKDVHNVFDNKRIAEVAIVDNLHNRMKERRNLRNDFFHSAKLLRLSIAQSDCIEAFCDLLDYGELLFQGSWKDTLSAGRTLGTLEILLRLDLKSYGNPSITSKVNEIFENCPQYRLPHKKNIPKKGIQIAKYADELHLILSVIGGGQELRDKLAGLLR